VNSPTITNDKITHSSLSSFQFYTQTRVMKISYLAKRQFIRHSATSNSEKSNR